MRIAAHQPNFLPNLAFFSKMNEVDLFVIITNIRFEKQEGWQRRHKIHTASGDIWLTVPVNGSQNSLIKDVTISAKDHWNEKHMKTLQMQYAKGNGREFLPMLQQIYQKEWLRLADINIAFISVLKDILGITTPMIVDENVSGIKHTLLINICKKYGADTYVSGIGAKDYLDSTRLAEIKASNIHHEFVSKDLGKEFPYSTVHYLLKEGRDAILHVI